MLPGILLVLTETWFWVGFGTLISLFLVLDLGFLNKADKQVTTKDAALQSAFWVALAVSFGAVIYVYFDPPGEMTAHDAAFLYLTAYVSEYALSVDNIFVIILILRYFQIDEKYYHKTLFWGILGAMVMRGLFIGLGAQLVSSFEWILYIFGAFLLWSGVKMLFSSDEDKDFDPESNPLFRWIRKFLRFTQSQGDGKFFIREHGKIVFTRIFLVLFLIETTDLIFAVDSVPAAFGITKEPMLLYTSNIFAVLGLRAMFFMLAGVLDKFYLLSKGLSLVLIFIGAKMFVESASLVNEWFGTSLPHVQLSAKISLSVILVLLFGAILLSVIMPKKEKAELPAGVSPNGKGKMEDAYPESEPVQHTKHDN